MILQLIEDLFPQMTKLEISEFKKQFLFAGFVPTGLLYKNVLPYFIYFLEMQVQEAFVQC